MKALFKLKFLELINSITKGQHEVSASLGVDFWKKMRFVILPQAIKVVLPALDQFVYVLKMSSLVSIIGIADLTRKANELVTTTYRPLEIYTFFNFGVFNLNFSCFLFCEKIRK